MRILHSVPHIHVEASGPSHSVPSLAASQARGNGHSVAVLCQGPGKTIEGVAVESHREWGLGPRWRLSPGALLASASAGRRCDVHHAHGLWSGINLVASMLPAGENHVLVFSPRGTLLPQAMAQKGGVKRVFWPIQATALRRARLLHATSIEECEALRQLGFRQHVAVIPNGIAAGDCPPGSPKRRVLLYLGRLYQGKGLERLIRCWDRVGSATSGWRLVLAGSGEPAYEGKLKQMIAASAAKNIEMIGGVYGDQKWRLLASSSALALLSDSENFGMSVAEALAAGTPVLVGRGAPWQVAQRLGFGWWVDTATDAPVCDALRKVLACSEDLLQQMGQLGKAWTHSELAWDSVARRMLEAYEFVRGGGSKPAFVH